MPLHLTKIASYASGSEPDPTALEVGFPILVDGELKVVNATQDGFDTVVSGGAVETSAATYTITDETLLICTATCTVTLPEPPTAGRKVAVKSYSGGGVTVQAGNDNDSIEFGTAGPPTTYTVAVGEFVEWAYSAAPNEEWVQLVKHAAVD